VDAEENPKGLKSIKPIRKENFTLAFQKLWSSLFESPVHLDSALSKQPAHLKSKLAQIIPSILLRPVSQAEALGIGVSSQEPWGLSQEKLAHWRAASLMADRLYEGMTERRLDALPLPEDFPPHMVEDWRESFGKDVAQELSKSLALDAPLSLRASRSIGAEELHKRLTEGSRLPVRARVSDLTPLGVRLSGYAPVLSTDLYKEGLFEIQDEGSQLMALFALWPEIYGAALQEHPGQANFGGPLPPLPEARALNIVDACAGAGGKSIALSDAMKGKGRIYSYDISEKKLQSLRRRATQAGLNNIQAVALEEGQESKILDRFKATADIVLVDAPCSGWGVLRRNPDIKWRQSKEVLERMPQIQSRLLDEYSKLVKSGGRLVFGVCTFRKAETRDIVEAFLKSHPDFKPLKGGFLGPGPCDGFFMQAFKKA
jgi:16S rRNA C967 or C1407 C5-methylase (RsmB/RsmF family)